MKVVQGCGGVLVLPPVVEKKVGDIPILDWNAEVISRKHIMTFVYWYGAFNGRLLMAYRMSSYRFRVCSGKSGQFGQFTFNVRSFTLIDIVIGLRWVIKLLPTLPQLIKDTIIS